ncbi:MAG: TonB family protein [Rhodocyclaceae bacterium]|nr:TonB family protein [Rhodocyclaceae bacterium]
MESSSWQQEKTRNLRGFPLRPVLLSLFLHALVLLGLAPQFAPAEFSVPPASILQGVLLPGTPPVSVAAAAPEAILQRDLSPAAVVATPPRPVRETNVAATQKLQPDPAPTQPAAANAALPVPQGFPSVTPTFAQPSVPNKTQAIASDTPGGVVSRTTAGPATVAMAKESSDSGANAAGLRQFRVALASEARRFRRYPETARREGLTGTAEVRVTIETGLPARRVDLSRSSGYAVLDAAAVEMLRQAVTRVELPESLRGQNFAVLLPVVFEVED